MLNRVQQDQVRSCRGKEAPELFVVQHIIVYMYRVRVCVCMTSCQFRGRFCIIVVLGVHGQSCVSMHVYVREVLPFATTTYNNIPLHHCSYICRAVLVKQLVHSPLCVNGKWHSSYFAVANVLW